MVGNDPTAWRLEFPILPLNYTILGLYFNIFLIKQFLFLLIVNIGSNPLILYKIL
jgi:hypothetical protein